MTVKLATAVRNAMMDAITAQAGASAKLRFYTGTRPANPQTAVSSQVLLAELTCNATFAPAASGGVLTMNAITADSAADATGTAAWARLFKSDGTTVIGDFDVGTSGSDINMNSTSITSGSQVAISSFTITDGNA